MLLLAGSTGATQEPPARVSPPVADESGFAQADGYRIYYETFGEGDPIVLLHGWGGSIEHWVGNGWVDALTPLRRVIAIDARGHGASDKPHDQSVYAYEQLSHDVLSVMDHLSIATADLLGYSMGSFTGSVLLRTAPSRFNAMILGGFGSETVESLAILPTIVAGLRAEDAAGIEDSASSGYRAYALQDPRADLEALALSALQIWPESVALLALGSEAGNVDTPVLVLNGADDHPYVDNVEDFVDAIRHAELVVIPGVDHFTAFADPRTKEAALAFLADR